MTEEISPKPNREPLCSHEWALRRQQRRQTPDRPAVLRRNGGRMTTPRTILASTLQAGPATVIVALAGHTLRSLVVMAIAEPHGIVRVAFSSGDVLAYDAAMSCAWRRCGRQCSGGPWAMLAVLLPTRHSPNVA